MWVSSTVPFLSRSRFDRPNESLDVLDLAGFALDGVAAVGEGRTARTASRSLQKPLVKECRAGSESARTSVIHWSRCWPWSSVIIMAKLRTWAAVTARSGFRARIWARPVPLGLVQVARPGHEPPDNPPRFGRRRVRPGPLGRGAWSWLPGLAGRRGRNCCTTGVPLGRRL
jgi:hypothetical protein